MLKGRSKHASTRCVHINRVARFDKKQYFFGKLQSKMELFDQNHYSLGTLVIFIFRNVFIFNHPRAAM